MSGKLPLPPSRSTESDQSSERCHSVLSMLAQRSPVSAALHSTDLDASDSEDDPEHEAEGTFRNISFLNLGSPSPGSIANEPQAKEEPQALPTGAFDFDEDLQAMPLLQSDPVAPILPSIDPESSMEASMEDTRRSTDATAQMGVLERALESKSADGDPEQHAHSTAHDHPPTAPTTVRLRLAEQLRVVMQQSATDAAESPLRPSVSVSWSVKESVATIGRGMKDLSLYID